MYVEYRENRHPFAMDQWISITEPLNGRCWPFSEAKVLLLSVRSRVN